MKAALRYLFIICIGIIAIVFFIFYREYMGEDTEENTNSLVSWRLNAVITDTSVSANKSNAGLNSLKIDYEDIDTKETSSFFINYRDHTSLAIGDTVTKEKGDKLLFIYRQQGTVTSVPID